MIRDVVNNIFDGRHRNFNKISKVIKLIVFFFEAVKEYTCFGPACDNSLFVFYSAAKFLIFLRVTNKSKIFLQKQDRQSKSVYFL